MNEHLLVTVLLTFVNVKNIGNIDYETDKLVTECRTLRRTRDNSHILHLIFHFLKTTCTFSVPLCFSLLILQPPAATPPEVGLGRNCNIPNEYAPKELKAQSYPS